MLTLYHNPRCSKSRACLQLLQEASIPVTVVDYTRQGLSYELLEHFADKLSLDTIIRKNEAIYKELNLSAADKKTVLRAVINHPQLLQRPIAVLGEKMVLARPPEKIGELVHE
ncbi:ArsC/Spx/MgsR family protein [Legionella jamestowniensis]|uniref:Oxidoreductase n=1 Tax=Legionella jamestowniensis TaxID=455 RepID=A0A0W0UHA3_9GAMM|nr:ArsC/Spx/MgsR family protein [Legionella jamestowniensis]KTD07235.1 oxidoreductase [Legionella jamestowniensis]OCH98014.1 hypothetical protein A8135_01975 [Legionella jamestowniensis]SFL95882.1 arsenate reductase [Legionella jamestowniensis DSM 19215]